MDHFNYLQDRQILIFLMELLVILGLTKVLSLPLKRWGFSTLPAELLVGVALGPTLFGRLNPDLFHQLFPADPLQHYMLETVGWLGVLFLLLATGLEISLRSAWRQRSSVGVATLVSLVLPWTLGAGLIWGLNTGGVLPSVEGSFLESLFLGAFLATAAMPISVRILTELKILRSDFGIFSASVLSINDLFGWLAFTTLLVSLEQGVFNLGFFFQEAALTLVVTVAALGIGVTLGRLGRSRQQLGRKSYGREWTEGLTLLVFSGLILGGLTSAIGIHALYGFFLAGMALSTSGLVGENTRFSLSSLMESIFAPVFFAGVGLKIDFAAYFDLSLFLIFTLGALAFRFLGGWLAGKAVRLPGHQQILFGAVNLAGGELHVIAGLAALEAGVIGLPVFSALVSGAIVTSLVATPLSSWALSLGKGRGIQDWIHPEGIIPQAEAATKEALFLLMAQKAAPLCEVNADTLFRAMIERESLMTTALGQGLAFPHARLKGLREPLVIPSRVPKGIQDWDSPDGQPITLAFFILTPEENPEIQLSILKNLIKAASPPEKKKALLEALSAKEIQILLKEYSETSGIKDFRNGRSGNPSTVPKEP